jgi:hypothetical protein
MHIPGEQLSLWNFVTSSASGEALPNPINRDTVNQLLSRIIPGKIAGSREQDLIVKVSFCSEA